jgi:cytoskeletal protein RodZ
VGTSQLETATSSHARKVSLGESLVAARQQRGLSRGAVVEQTHIPPHYLQMLEDDDYRLISDQLYLLPFLRKYASFLEIDQDETAMRLVREVQQVDNSPSPVRLDEPIDELWRYPQRNWSQLIMFGGLVAVIIGAYLAQSRHDDVDSIITPTVQSSQTQVVSPSLFVLKESMNSFPASQSASATSVSGTDSSAPQQSTSGTTISTRRRTESVSQTIVPVASPDGRSRLPRRRTPSARQIPSR